MLVKCLNNNRTSTQKLLNKLLIAALKQILQVITMRVSLGKRFLLGTLGAPAGVLGSGVDGPRRNQLLIAQIIKILGRGGGDTENEEMSC